MTEPTPLRRCCAAFDKAQTTGTDNEGWSKLIYQNWKAPAGVAFIGLNLPPINYCPWCAAPVSKEAIDKQASDDLDAKADAEERDR